MRTTEPLDWLLMMIDLNWSAVCRRDCARTVAVSCCSLDDGSAPILPAETWIFCASIALCTSATAAITLSQEYELAVWNKADFLQQSRFELCQCRECARPFAVQKEIDYAIALLAHNGDTRAEAHRASFETCPACKRQQCLVPTDRIELTRHMREAS